MTVPPTTPSGWYPDPQHNGTQRFWDGAAWTEHIAPIAQIPPQRKRGMSGGAIAAIVVGGLVLVVFIIGILAAIAIPVFLNQREKAADAAAMASVQDVATQIGLVPLDNPSGSSTVEAVGSLVTITALDGTMRTSVLEPGVNFGGYLGNGDSWCVWVYAPKGVQKDFQYSSWNGPEQGNCSLTG